MKPRGCMRFDCPRRVYEVRRERQDTGLKELPTLQVDVCR